MVGVEPLEPGSALLDAVAQPMYLIPVCKVDPTSSLGAGRSLLPLYLHNPMQLLLSTYPSRRSIDNRKVCLKDMKQQHFLSLSLDWLDSICISSPLHKLAEIEGSMPLSDQSLWAHGACFP